MHSRFLSHELRVWKMLRSSLRLRSARLSASEGEFEAAPLLSTGRFRESSLESSVLLKFKWWHQARSKSL